MISLRLGSLVLLLGCALLPGRASAEPASPPTDLLKYKWEMFGETPDRTTVNLVQDGAGLAVTVKNLNDNTADTAPHLHVNFGGAQDWRRYQTIKCRMRLTSDTPMVLAGGKPITFCFYDQDTRHEMLNIPVQQSIDSRLAGGEWQDITLNLRPRGRSAITDVDVYLRILPYGITHEYKVEISQFELVKDDRPMFDGEGMSAPFPGGGGQALRTLATRDGLRLQLAKNGSVTGVALGDREIGGIARPGGFLIRDNASDAPPTAAGGDVRVEGDDVVQRSDLRELGLGVESRYHVEGNRVRVSLKVANRQKKTRFLTLYFALPLQKRAWAWGRDINETIPIPADSSRPYEETAVQYPLATLTTPDAGIALALPLDQPRNYRLAYNEQNGLLYAAFDVALTDLQTSAGKSLNEATCGVYVYTYDPRWGFRAALQAYYKAFPQWFAKRTARDGGWEIDRLLPPKYTKEEIVASGCRFAWEELPDEMWKWNAKNGILNTIYVEPEYVQLSMTDLKPSDEAALTRLRKLTEGDPEEWERMLKLHYTQRYANTIYAKRYGLKGYHQLLGRAAYNSGLWRADHRPEMGVGFGREWIGENQSGMMIPCNLDPQIPGGRGQAAITLLETEADGYRKDLGLTTDGWSLDSYVCDDTYDYRAENFVYSSLPLTFEQGKLDAAVPIRLTMASWARHLAGRSHPSNRVLFANLVGNFTFSAPYIDIFGTESGWVSDPAYQRSMAYHRSVNYLPYTPKPDLDVFFNFLYGIYPGRGLAQEQYLKMVPLLDKITPAGWEPVTYAATDAPRVRVERFGSGDRCYLVFHNNDPAARDFKVTVDRKALDVPLRKAAVLFGPQAGQNVEVSGGSFALKLGSRETCVVKLD